jgi:hypothetical protein
MTPSPCLCTRDIVRFTGHVGRKVSEGLRKLSK